MISSRTSRKLAEPWFAINKSIYDGILDVALADVLTPPMTSSPLMSSPTLVPTTNCSELLKLLNDNEDIKPGELGTKHHVIVGANDYAIINRDVSPVFDSATASSRHEIDHKSWNNSTASDNLSAARECGTGAARLQGTDLHLSAAALVSRIHSPSRDCFSISRLNRRSMLSRNRNNNSSAILSSRPNANRTMHTKPKRSKTNQEKMYFNQSPQLICQSLSAAEFEMNEIVRDLNASVTSASRLERFSESSNVKCPRKAPLVMASRTNNTHNKEQNEKKKKRATSRKQTNFVERAMRSNTSIMELAPMKGRSKAPYKMSISQGIEDSKNRPGYTVNNSTDTNKNKEYNSQESECYPLDLTVSNLSEASSLVLTKVPREIKEVNSGRKPEIMNRLGKITKEPTIVGKTQHVDAPSDPAKVCWTKVEKDTLLKVVERLSITCLVEEVDNERSQIAVDTSCNSAPGGDLFNSQKLQTPLSIHSATTTSAEMPSPVSDTKTNLTKRTSFEVDSEVTPIKSVKLLSDSCDVVDSCDVYMTSPSTSVKVAQNTESLRLSPSVSNIYEKNLLRSSPTKDAKLTEMRTSRKRVHFNELQPCATSDEHSQGLYKRPNVLTKHDRSSSSKLSRGAHEDSAYSETHDSVHSDDQNSVFSENQESEYLEIPNTAYILGNEPLSRQFDTKDDSNIETEQNDMLLSERNRFLSQCSDSALKTCHDIYLTTTRKVNSTSENSYDNPSAAYENTPRKDAAHVTSQKLFNLESSPNTLRDHSLNIYPTDYKSSEQDSGKEDSLRTTRNGTKRNNLSNHQHVVIRVEDTGNVSQQFWAAVDKTIVSNMVDQILTSAVNCNSHSVDERYLFEHRNNRSSLAERSATTREMNYYRSAEAVWQHFHDLNDSQHVARRTRRVPVKSARRNDAGREEDASNDADDVTCDVIESGLCVVDSETAFEGQGESGSTEGHSTFKWKSNILKRVRIDQIMTSPAPISDWRRSPNVASPVAV